MPDSGFPSGSDASMHESLNDDDDDCEFEETDPSGRYGRYREVLGKGAFKTVYRAFDKVDGIEVAWNQIEVQDVHHTAEDLERLYSEVHLLKTLKHKNIMKFYHSWVDTETMNINFITEIFTSGTLRQYRKRHKHVDIRAVKNWARQILRGLLYLHSHDPPIIHRDLKCDNIFINGNQGEVKIGDLGLAAVLRQAHAAHSVIGTPEFMAPELYEEEYTELVDIYSFGMCLVEMVTSEYPYSECTNAAQIYKKVTLGKKPEALNKFKDAEFRQFVEKCIASASIRLSARELLMDPFLRCDGDHEPTEGLPVLGTVTTHDMDDLGALLGKAYCSPFVCGNLAETDSLPEGYPFSISMPADQLKAVTDTEHSLTKTFLKQPLSPHLREDKRGRNVDFRVKGKRRENDTVYLRLRMADTEGEVRNIQFPFDVEVDTAMSVASEMVAELDLTDQDVTKIAEMIDAAILAMVPEWRPGVAIDEAYGEAEDHLSKTPIHSGYMRTYLTPDHQSTISSESSLIDLSQQCPRSCTDSVEAMTAGPSLPPQTDGMIHGRFEEVLHHHRAERSVQVEEEHHTISSLSSEELPDWEPTNESSSPISHVSYPSLPQNVSGSVHSSLGTAVRTTAAAFNELEESKRNGGVCDLNGGTEDDYSGVVVDKLKNAELFQRYLFGQKYDPDLDYLASFDDDDNEQLVTIELQKLGFRYWQELRELQHKHEAALRELTNRWQCQRGSSSLPRTGRPNTELSRDENVQEGEANSSREQTLNKLMEVGHQKSPESNCQNTHEKFLPLGQILNKHIELGHNLFSYPLPRNLSDSDIGGNFPSSVKGLAALQMDTIDGPWSSRDFTDVEGLLNLEEIALPDSIKVKLSKASLPNLARDEWGTNNDPFYKLAVEKSSCHKVATLKGQNLVDSNAGVLFLHLKAEALEQVPI